MYRRFYRRKRWCLSRLKCGWYWLGQEFLILTAEGEKSTESHIYCSVKRCRVKENALPRAHRVPIAPIAIIRISILVILVYMQVHNKYTNLQSMDERKWASNATALQSRREFGWSSFIYIWHIYLSMHCIYATAYALLSSLLLLTHLRNIHTMICFFSYKATRIQFHRYVI